MNRRDFLIGGLASLAFWRARSWAKSADAPAAASGNRATIFYSFAPWDGAAYDLEIPLEPKDGTHQPYLRISIWGYPECREAKTFYFSGKEDPGGGPLKGDGSARFQDDLNKSMPEKLAGSVSFWNLQYDHLVRGSYDLATLDGARKFKSPFQATWGNKPAKAIR